jgi:hypothetical protein
LRNEVIFSRVGLTFRNVNLEQARLSFWGAAGLIEDREILISQGDGSIVLPETQHGDRRFAFSAVLRFQGELGIQGALRLLARLGLEAGPGFLAGLGF